MTLAGARQGRSKPTRPQQGELQGRSNPTRPQQQAVNFWYVLVMNDEHTERRYLLYSLLSWGLPAFVFILLLIILRGIYQHSTAQIYGLVYGDLKDIEVLKCDQRRATELGKDLEHKSYEEWLSLGKTSLRGGLITVYNSMKGGCSQIVLEIIFGIHGVCVTAVLKETTQDTIFLAEYESTPKQSQKDYPTRCFIPNAYAALFTAALVPLMCLVVVFVVFIHAYQVTPQWKAYDDIFRGRTNAAEIPLVLYLFALISITWLWGGLHMAYRHLWMLVFFIIFNSLQTDNGRIEWTPSKFGGNINLCVAVDTLEGSDAIQRDLDVLETWVHANLMEFKKAECDILHLGHGNSKHTYRLGREVTESCPEEKDLVVMIDEKLNMSQQHAPNRFWAASKGAWPAG
ncbi:G-protein coupled receptor [Turdus rufiventris]|nr:G-protein coupled receptor [Turdus rufiventris]